MCVKHDTRTTTKSKYYATFRDIWYTELMWLIIRSFVERLVHGARVDDRRLFLLFFLCGSSIVAALGGKAQIASCANLVWGSAWRRLTADRVWHFVGFLGRRWRRVAKLLLRRLRQPNTHQTLSQPPSLRPIELLLMLLSVCRERGLILSLSRRWIALAINTLSSSSSRKRSADEKHINGTTLIVVATNTLTVQRATNVRNSS